MVPSQFPSLDFDTSGRFDGCRVAVDAPYCVGPRVDLDHSRHCTSQNTSSHHNNSELGPRLHIKKRVYLTLSQLILIPTTSRLKHQVLGDAGPNPSKRFVGPHLKKSSCRLIKHYRKLNLAGSVFQASIRCPGASCCRSHVLSFTAHPQPRCPSEAPQSKS